MVESDKPDQEVWPTDWSRDGRFFLCTRGDVISQSRGEIWAVPTSGDSKPRVLVRAAAAAYDARFSPNGRWVAYTSSESGREEIYVSPFDGARVLSTPPMEVVALAGKTQVSANGGALPRWRGDGKELYYIERGSQFVATSFEEHAGAPAIGQPRPLFRKRTFFSGSVYDVSPDGSRFVVNSFPDEASTSLRLVTNWMELVKNK